MLVFKRDWIDLENKRLLEQKESFLIRFLIILFFALITPLGYFVCLTMSNEEWEYLYGGKT